MTTTTTTPATLAALLDLCSRERGYIDARRLTIGDRELFADLMETGVVADAVHKGVLAPTERGFRLVPQVGMGATVRGYSDRHPYEVVAVSPSGKQVTLRAMKAERDPTWQPEWVAGGFAGHCTNQHDQRWVLSSDPNGEIVKAHLRKDGQFYEGCNPVTIGHAYRFYDYNF